MDAEKQLAKYSDEFYEDSPFVPFPTVDAAIEAITETGVQVIPTSSRVEFYEAIIKRIQAEIDKENTWFDFEARYED